MKNIISKTQKLKEIERDRKGKDDMAFKVTFIGAGSIAFTREILSGILSVKEFADIRVCFHDINQKNLDMVTQLCQRDIESNGLNVKIEPTLNRREAVSGAKYIIVCVRIGGLEAFETDVNIPLKYGVDQCVGDTICAGGIMYGQRGIPAALDFCRDIRETGEPGAMILNYANPNAMMTWACNKYGGVYTVGLCHGVQNGHKQIAAVFGLEQKDIDIICAGINHQTWYLSIKHNGAELKDKLLAAMENHPEYKETEKVRIDILRRFGYYSTESNGHLSEYLPWYRKRPGEISKWIDLRGWIHGETGGYLRACTKRRKWFETDFPNWMNAEPRKFDYASRGQEHAAYMIESFETGRIYRGHFNVVNNGCISNLPGDCIVEVPGYCDGMGISIPRVGELPHACAAICGASVAVQRLAVEAAVGGDIYILRQAMMLDPLTGAVCSPEEIDRMTDEMLVAGEKWLPQYAQEIQEAKKRLKDTQIR